MSLFSARTLLVIEPRPGLVEKLQATAAEIDFVVRPATLGSDALKASSAAIAIVDCGGAALESSAWAQIGKLARELPTIVLVSDGAPGALKDPDSAIEAFLPWPSGEPLMAATLRSILKRSRGAEELLRSEEMFRSVAEDAAVGIGSIDLTGKWVWANARLCRIFGCESKGLLQTFSGDAVARDSIDAFQGQLKKILEGRTDKVAVELACERRGGASFWASWHLSTVRRNDGKPLCIVAVVEDISLRLWTRANLIKIRTAVEASSDGMAIADPDCRFTFYNRAFERLFGYSGEELGYPGAHINLFADRCVAETVMEKIRGGGTWHGEVEMKSRAGKSIPVELRADGIFDEQGAFIGFVGVHTDVSARKESQRRIHQLSRAVEQTASIVAITDTKGRIEYVNPKFEETTGYTAAEAIGKNPNILKSGFLGSEAYAELWRTISGGKTWRGEFLNKKKSGELFWEYATISPVLDEAGVITHFIAVKENITERKQLESRLLQAQKMEAIGQLAGRVAHDFNNMLAVIRGHAELLHISQESLPAGLNESTNQIIRACDSAANLARQLLIFSRRRDLDPQKLLINQLVTRLAVMLKRLLPEEIELECNLSDTVPTMEADPVMLEQVVMNLVVNARDAIAGKGKVRIATDLVELSDEAFCHNHPDARPGNFVRLLVEDNGSGIPPEVLPHIFEPFFTTKKSRKGTGLGLATVHTVVQQHSGWVDVQSAVGKGTTFTAYLPVVQPAKDSAGDLAPMLAQGHESILFIDGNAQSRAKTRQNLEALGFKVHAAVDAGQAIDIWENHSDEISLLLTDLVLPDDVRGGDLANQLRLERPELRVVIMCSDAGLVQSELANLKGTGAQRPLPLPYNLRTLSKAVRECLDQPIPIDRLAQQIKG